MPTAVELNSPVIRRDSVKINVMFLAPVVSIMLEIKLNTGKSVRIDKQKGFTLIEIICVLIIMGVIASIAIKKLDLLTDKADIAALETGVRELKIRESVTWLQIKLSDTGYTDDLDLFKAVDKDLGQGYFWDPDPDISGGRLHFKSRSIDLIRVQSTPSTPANWM